MTSTTPAGGAGNPATASTRTSGTTVTFTIADAVVESCTATATSTGLAPASSTINFVGTGTATHLVASAAPNPIPANGSSQSTITVCVKDAANGVTSATDSINLVFTSSTGGASHGTSPVTATPQAATNRCAAFAVRSTTPTATDTYTATDLSRSITGTTATITTN